MTVLDTQALVAGLTGEPAVREVEAILRERGAVPMISAITLAETMDVLVRTRGIRTEKATESVELLLAGGLEVVPVDQETAWLAGVLRARHWRRDTRPVSPADCAVLATAMIHHEPVATADVSLIGAARAEGHPVVVLPDSQGRRAG